jgi:four helix bundle protein
MQVNSVEQLQVWQASRRFVAALSAVTRCGSLSSDQGLREQIDTCADSIVSNIAEGFEQGTDRGFARYLCIARGSCAEARAHVSVAQMRGYLTSDTADELRKDGAEILRMLTGLVNYLFRSGRKFRGQTPWPPTR